MNLDVLFEKALHIPPIPKVLQELIDSMNNPRADLSSIGKKISVDQSLSTKVLRLANSAHFGLGKSVASIDDAILLMGFCSLRTLVIASGMSATFRSIPGLDAQWFWRHSLFSATASKWMAGHAKINADTAFTAGLLHGIGIVLIHMAFPEQASAMAAELGNADAAQRVAMEQAELGVDHASAGAELARRWRFPDEIQAAIGGYANPNEQSVFSPFAGCVNVGVYLASALDRGESLENIALNMPVRVCSALHVHHGKFIDEVPKLIELNAELASLL